LSIAKLAEPPGVAARDLAGVLRPNKHFTGQGLEQRLTPGRPRARSGRLISHLLFLVYLFFVHQGESTFASRRKRADSSGGVGLM
jgi:hypothetical protein